MKYLFTILLISINLHASAQSVKLTTEETIKQKFPRPSYANMDQSWTYFQDGNNTIRIDCKGGDKFEWQYFSKLYSQNCRVTIYKYDSNGDEILVNKLENDKKVFALMLPEAIEFNKKILLFYFRVTDKDAPKLYVSELDKNDLSLKNTQEVCTYGQTNEDVAHSKKGIYWQMLLKLSDDKKKLLLAAPVYKDELFTCVYASDMSIIRKKTSQFIIKDDIMISDALLENTGNNSIVFKDFQMTGELSGTFLPSVKGILLQKVNNTEVFIDANFLDEEHRLVDAHFGISKYSSKTILFGDYLDKNWGAGIWLTDIESENLKINKALLIPYPEDFAKRVCNLGFGKRLKDNYGLETLDYEMAEFENGDIAFCGSPTNHGLAGVYLVNADRDFSSAASIYSGPIMAAFISSNRKQNVFTMIPRYLDTDAGIKGIFITYKDKLLVFYNDFEKNITGELLSDDVQQKKKGILSLAYASILKDGKIESRTILELGSSKDDYYKTKNGKIISDRKILIPYSNAEKKSNVIKVANISIE